jgi:hypothetical protein
MSFKGLLQKESVLGMNQTIALRRDPSQTSNYYANSAHVVKGTV